MATRVHLHKKYKFIFLKKKKKKKKENGRQGVAGVDKFLRTFKRILVPCHLLSRKKLHY
jgi:hypothetical protein